MFLRNRKKLPEMVHSTRSNDPPIKPNKGIDESIISVFNIIFEPVLFIFDSVLYNIISFFELFYFNCKLFNFRNKYSKD